MERGKVDAIVEVDEPVLGRELDRWGVAAEVMGATGFGLRCAVGLSGDGEEGRESDVAQGKGTVLVGDVVSGPSFDDDAAVLMSSLGRGGDSNESIKTVPTSISRRLPLLQRKTGLSTPTRESDQI